MKTEFFSILIFLTTMYSASANDGMGDFMPGRGPEAGYEGRGGPETQHHRLRVSMPVYKNGEHGVHVSASGGTLDLGSAPILSESGTRVPQRLHRAEVGSQYNRRFADGRSWGLRFSAGSASDKPFHSGKEVTGTLGATYSFASGERGRWILMLFASNNSLLLNYVPLPGAIYLNRGEEWTYMLGFPVNSVSYAPLATKWKFSAGIFVVNMNAEISYGHAKEVQAFAGYQWDRQSFLRADRTDSKLRLTVREMRGMGGVRFPLVAGLAAEINGGYAFERVASETRKLGKKTGGEADLPSTWLAGLGLRTSF